VARLAPARAQFHRSELIQGSKDEIQKTLQRSVEAFFDMYPEI
jgi:hypothetical protein